MVTVEFQIIANDIRFLDDIRSVGIGEGAMTTVLAAGFEVDHRIARLKPSGKPGLCPQFFQLNILVMAVPVNGKRRVLSRSAKHDATNAKRCFGVRKAEETELGRVGLALRLAVYSRLIWGDRRWRSSVKMIFVESFNGPETVNVDCHGIVT